MLYQNQYSLRQSHCIISYLCW